MHRHTDGVDDPTQHHLNCAPRAVPLPQLLERHRLSLVWVVVGAQGADDAVNCMQQDLSCPPPARPPLVETQEVVHKDVDVLEGLAGIGQTRVSVQGPGRGRMVFGV